MSFVSDTITDINLKRMATRLEGYELLVQAAAPCFEITGKSLEEVSKRHAQDLHIYSQVLQECKTIEDVCRLKLEELEGQLYKKYNENQQRVLSQRDILQYIKGDPDYVQISEVVLSISLVRRQLESIVDTLKTMGWNINNITKIRISNLQDVYL